jgi:UDPglucose 6-dehydrogenase
MVTGAANAVEAAEGSDAVLIMTPWPQFRSLAPAEFAAVMAGRVMVDPFRVLEPAAARAAALSYFTLGASGSAA